MRYCFFIMISYLICACSCAYCVTPSESKKEQPKTSIKRSSKLITRYIVDTIVLPFLKTRDLTPHLAINKDDLQFAILDEATQDTAQYYQVSIDGLYLDRYDFYVVSLTVKKDKISEKIVTKLLYIAKNTFGPSTQLFYDILRNPSFRLGYPKAYSLLSCKDLLIFITNEELRSGKRIQRWDFHTSNKKYIVPILMADDKKGGTVFTLIMRNNEDLDSTILALRELAKKDPS